MVVDYPDPGSLCAAGLVSLVSQTAQRSAPAEQADQGERSAALHQAARPAVRSSAHTGRETREVAAVRKLLPGFPARRRGYCSGFAIPERNGVQRRLVAASRDRPHPSGRQPRIARSQTVQGERLRHLRPPGYMNSGKHGALQLPAGGRRRPKSPCQTLSTGQGASRTIAYVRSRIRPMDPG
jgi:hypothetical protein